MGKSGVTKRRNPTSGAIGIDLGTTYSCIGVFRNGSVKIISNKQGYLTTPSCVAFDDKQRLIGNAAKDQIGLNPCNTVYNVYKERLMKL